ncbi:hypothetical protein KUCAC02_025743 [Chaenocephalus aceratus]|uniref:Uncharacterized protein n=1 Tax=Chaenocephalus aceratus TaxID=36190 RepID=A0ACB9VVY3_CHAAC|nr:hypothetical protein KUCAC02_025743 [Chaenocephalus aceratus]
MISIKRAAGDDFNYPCSRELTVMAKRLIEYYPMLRDRSQTSRAEWETVKKQLLKRIQNEQDRPSNILKAYPCFGELDHLMDELRRVLNQGNSHFLMELKTRWGTFCERAQFYGVFKKLMRPPQLDKVKHSIAMMKALPEMFPSPMAPPKKLRHASEAVLHVLETRPLSSPVVIICETNCILAIGTMPVLIFPKEDIHESTEVLLDAIHDCDMTTSYKKAMADWKKFISD